MRRISHLFILLFLWSFAALSQGDLVRVRSGHSFQEEFPIHVRYRFVKYVPGKLTYLNGKTAAFRYLNYDFLFEGIMCVQITGDTIAVADQPEFKEFDVNGVIYYRTARDKYIEILEQNEHARLGMRKWYSIKRKDHNVNDTYSSYVNNVNSTAGLGMRNQGHGRMVYDVDLLMGESVRYYLVDNSGTVYKASKRNFIRVFGAHSAEIEKFLDTTYTDFRSYPSLIRLFDFCSALSAPSVGN